MTANQFTAEQQQRWDTWVEVSTRRGAGAERMARIAVSVLFLALLVAVSIAVWRM